MARLLMTPASNSAKMKHPPAENHTMPQQVAEFVRIQGATTGAGLGILAISATQR
jgi:hypothetical protein